MSWLANACCTAGFVVMTTVEPVPGPVPVVPVDAKRAAFATLGKLAAREPRLLLNWVTTCSAMKCWIGMIRPVVGSI